MITICLTYFRSLGLLNLMAALFSVRQQSFDHVKEIVIVDNNTTDLVANIQTVIDSFAFPVPVRLLSYKHEDPAKTHAWSSNIAVAAAHTPWVLFTRADYILDPNLLMMFSEVVQANPDGWNGFVTGNVYHLHVDVGVCEQAGWRVRGVDALRRLPGVENDYMVIDAGVWLARKDAFEHVGGLDEGLPAWGHAQTHFQHKLFLAGTQFVRIPTVLFYHPMHSGARDIHLAHAQLRAKGVDLKEMWARYEGVPVY